jgi:hypothetical protein
MKMLQHVMCPILAGFLGCTSPTACSSAVPVVQSAILFPNYVLKCWPLTGLIVTAALTPFLQQYGSTPLIRHPPVHPPLKSALTVSACLLIPLGLRSLRWVSQLPQGLASKNSGLDVIAATPRFLPCVPFSFQADNFPPVLQNLWQKNHVRIGPVSEAVLSAIVFASMIADRPMEMAVIVSDPQKQANVQCLRLCQTSSNAVHDRLMFR